MYLEKNIRGLCDKFGLDFEEFLADLDVDAVDELAVSDLEVICVEEDPTYEYDVNIGKILANVGIPVEQHTELMSTLDSADKFKVLLAQVLFPRPDVLFLDEPTNNLDIETISWLEFEEV
jgi:ATPase subunit of ABC transporter with duplicated ATPase domains